MSSWSVWMLALVTIVVNLFATAFYPMRAIPKTRGDEPGRSAILYVVSRSGALVLATVAGLAVAELGLGPSLLWGVAAATALVQAVDVFIAATTGEPAGRRGLTWLTVIALVVQLATILVAALWGR